MNTDKSKEKNMYADCEHCEYYFFDGDTMEDVCLADLDEDDEVDFLMHGNGKVCKYFRPYDEYKTVRKQN